VFRLIFEVKLRLQMLPSKQHSLSALFGCQELAGILMWHASISPCLVKAQGLKDGCLLLQTTLLMPCNGKDKWMLILRDPL